MTAQEIESAIEVTEKLVKYLQGVLQRSKEGNKHNPELYLCLELQNETLKQILSLQTLLSVTQLFLEVQKGMPIKTCHIIIDKNNRFKCEICSMKHNCSCISYNLAINLCTAHLAGKMKGIEKINP